MELTNKRKLIVAIELLNEIVSHKQVKGESVSFSRYPTKIMSLVNDMEENGSPLLSKLE